MSNKLLGILATHMLLFSQVTHALISVPDMDEAPAVPFLAAQQVDWQRSNCRVTSAPTLSQMQNYINNVEINSELTNASAAGVSFQQEKPALIKAFQRMANEKDLQTAYQINPACDKVECAVRKVWGERLGIKLLYLNLKHGFNTSEYAVNSGMRITDYEADQILVTLAHLPAKFSEIGKNKRLNLVSKERNDIKATADTLPSRVHLFERWRMPYGPSTGFIADEVDKYIKQYSLYHEMGHLVGFAKSKLGFLQGSKHSSSGWKKMNKLPHCVISKYATTTPVEDFAEAFASYRFNSWGLKFLCPEKYEYMKNEIYDNQEYLSPADCR